MKKVFLRINGLITVYNGILHYTSFAFAKKIPLRITTESYRYFFLCVTLFSFLSSCSSNEIKPNTAPLTSTDDLPSQTSHHTKMSFSSGGMIRAVMNAIGVRTFEQKRYTLLDSSVHVDFFTREGSHSSLLTSHRAFIDDNTHNMTAYDSVHILSDSGTLVETDSLVWDNNTHKLRSEADVRITEKSGRITRGKGFESDQDLINYRILQPIIDAPTGTFENHSQAPAFSSPSQSLGMPPPIPVPPEVKQDSSH
ncbi:MAG: LPS export ABC transporter periplasmic protein LptC [Ignavibacteriota bacterium]